jgi:uncharacterized protein (TIGR00290 family)
MPRQTVLCWSSGKDSAWALHVLRQRPDIELTGLLTTINEVHDRVAMHAVRTELVRQQADAAGLPLRIVTIPSPCSNEAYKAAMRAVMEEARAQGIECIAFGDLFLDEIRRYREENLAGTGLTPVFPLWGLPTDRLARDMVATGLGAVITCVDPRQADARFIGRKFDESLIAELPAGVDPCGENGEFHTFVFAGPMFAAPIDIQVGEVVEREGFIFADVLGVNP